MALEGDLLCGGRGRALAHRSRLTASFSELRAGGSKLNLFTFSLLLQRTGPEEASPD